MEKITWKAVSASIYHLSRTRPEFGVIWSLTCICTTAEIHLFPGKQQLSAQF